MHGARVAVRLLLLTSLSGIVACLPVPNRVADTPRLGGILVASGRPIRNAKLAVGPWRSDTNAICQTAPLHLVSDTAGGFSAEQHKHWEPWIFLLGEAPEWHQPWRLCMWQGEGEGEGTAGHWQVIYRTSSNLWEPVRLHCDLDAPARANDRTGSAGQCVEQSPLSLKL